jgi:hypothetical protein
MSGIIYSTKTVPLSALAEQLFHNESELFNAIDHFAVWHFQNSSESDQQLGSVGVEQMRQFEIEMNALNAGKMYSEERKAYIYSLVNKRRRQLKMNRIAALEVTHTGQGTRVVFA